WRKVCVTPSARTASSSATSIRICPPPGQFNTAAGRKEKGPLGPFPFLLFREKTLHVHAAHAAHVGHAAMGVAAAALLLFHQLRDHRVGGEHQAGDRRRVL